MSAIFNYRNISMAEIDDLDKRALDEGIDWREGFLYKDPNHFYYAIAMLAVFSVTGTIGNALVLYVYSHFKRDRTSTIFILTLAGIDFTTSLVTMPFSIVVEMMAYVVKYDAVCKIYHFLLASTVPLSAFIMVAIALDRYLCISHPFLHMRVMTAKKARIIVAALTGLAVTFGILDCLDTGMFKWIVVHSHIPATNDQTHFDNDSMTSTDAIVLANTSARGSTRILFDSGVCSYNYLILGRTFTLYYINAYIALFGICAVSVVILYALIYRTLLARMRAHIKVVPSGCGFWRCCCKPSNAPDQEDHAHAGNNIQTGTNEHLLHPRGNNSVYREKTKKVQRDNIRTAFRLSIVAVVFIAAYLPASLILFRVLEYNALVFYLYFIYNVANPAIYAFTDSSFREQLKKVCKSK
jgi:cholecystokinin A receptor